MRDREGRADGPTASSSEIGLEKAPGNSNRSSEIVYQYLTFETDVDEFLPGSRAENGDSTLPARPNLKPYTSPFLWSHRRKSITLALCCAATLCSAYTAGAYFMPAAALQQEWGLGTVAFNTGLTTWGVGFSISPMVLAPFSELTGRRPVFAGSGVVLVAAMIGCAATDSFAGMLVARFFVGAAASTFATMVGGVISDVYHQEERNTPMALYSGAALMGTGVGPLISGFIAQHLLWRWVFWFQVILDGVVFGSVIIFFKETRGSVLLSRKAETINKYLGKLENAGDHTSYHSMGRDRIPRSGNAEQHTADLRRPRLRFKVAADEKRSTIRNLIYLSLTTPFKLLVTEPVVFFFSLWAAFAWGILYMSFDDIPIVFAAHGFDIQQVGAVYAAIAVGSLIGTLLSIYQEKLAKRYWTRLTTTPEGRLYFACVESALLPLGLFWFGWTSFDSIPWVVPVFALGCAQIGIFSIYLAVFNYLADVYHRYASSALAAQSFCRNMLAAVFPLFTKAMFDKLGTPAATSLLGGISTLLTVVPWVLVFFGPRIRARSKVAKEIMTL